MSRNTGLPRNVSIGGIEIYCRPLTSIIKEIEQILKGYERGGLYITATSVHGVIEAQSRPEFKRILREAWANLPDGKPLVAVGRLLGARDMQQIRGMDLLSRVCELTSKREMDIYHFFYGGKEGVAEQLARKLKKKFPGIKIAGIYCPPFRPLTCKERKEVAAMINQGPADIVWVGLSTPKQELWIAEMRKALKVKLLFSVGAAFDFHTGLVKPAPVVFTRLGLEWFYRLIREPKRLGKRYFKIIPRFIWLATKILIKNFVIPGNNPGNKKKDF